MNTCYITNTEEVFELVEIILSERYSKEIIEIAKDLLKNGLSTIPEIKGRLKLSFENIRNILIILLQNRLINCQEIFRNEIKYIGYEIRYDHLYKIIIIGDSGVGKTSLLSKYIKGVFPSSPLPTIAIEFATKIIQIKEGGFIKAQIWDTAGQEKYKSITSHHYRKAVGGLIVYDITKRTTFDNVLQWLSDLKNNADKGCICALVGNKIDLVEKNHRIREVSEDEGKLLAKKYEMLFYETSALSNQSVNDAFEDLLQKIYIERRKITIIEKDKNNNVINLKTKGNIIKNNINICC